MVDNYTEEVLENNIVSVDEPIITNEINYEQTIDGMEINDIDVNSELLAEDVASINTTEVLDSNIFSINQIITNQDVVVTIMPPENTIRYEYRLYKDEELLSEIFMDGNNFSVLEFKETGNYHIEAKIINTELLENNIQSGIYQIDKVAPTINVKNKQFKIIQGKTENINSNATAIDNFDGDISSKITSNINEVNLNKVGTHTITYSVTDNAGNKAETQAVVIVKEDLSQILMVIDISFVLIGFLILGLLLRYMNSIKKEKRISKYTIEPLKDKSLSVVDRFFKFYFNLVSKLTPYFKKSYFLSKYSKRFEKYIGTVDFNHKEAISFVVTKTFIGMIFLLIALVSKTLHSDILHIYEMIIPFGIGFFIIDVLYFTKYKIYRSKVENDLLQAIIVMNNAFKSGRSIIQAIDLVANELEGPIAEEFKKMSLEISFGLAIEDVFQRFSERIKLSEVTYLTASLSILNKTGGNIIKVFSSIEKTLFSQKKLKLELKSLTGSSKIIVYILFVVPILFVTFISIIDPTYFLPLLTTPLGLIITFVVITVYIIYIFVVRKVMKVRM